MEEDFIRIYHTMIQDGPCVGLHVIQLLRLGLFKEDGHAVDLHVDGAAVILRKGTSYRLYGRRLYLPEDICAALRAGVGDWLRFRLQEET